MKNIRQMGIWMDHSNAVLMELTNEIIVTHSVVSEFANTERDQELMHGKLLQNKEQRSSFFKKLGDSIRNYQKVVLFGPTDAKNELLNLLKADHLFENIRIETKNADKMTVNQMHAFIREYFK